MTSIPETGPISLHLVGSLYGSTSNISMTSAAHALDVGRFPTKMSYFRGISVDPPAPDPYLNVSTYDVNLSPYGEDATLIVSSSSPWRVSTASYLELKVTPFTSSLETTNVTLFMPANETQVEKAGEVVFINDEGVTVTVHFTQSQAY